MSDKSSETKALAPGKGKGKGTAEALPSLTPFYREIATLPAKQRLDRIISRPDTMRVVRQMPVPDLLATINDIGVGDCLELLELMSPAQVQGFLDLDGWRKDRVDAAALGRWMQAFFAANPDRATGQLRGLDLELLVLLFKVHTRIYDLIAEEEPDHEVGRHSITPDQRYLICYGGVAADDATQATLQQAIEQLMGRDMQFVLKMCEAIRWELVSQLEEDAYRWRNARLADLGFLPAHEAAAIFAYLDPDKPLPGAGTKPAPPKFDKPDKNTVATNIDLTTSVLLPWSMLTGGGNEVLGRALRDVDDATRDRVAHELMLTANRVHAADGQDIGDTDALKETARHAAATAGTGLAYLVKGNEAALSSSLTSTSVMHLFRLGHSLSLKLANDLRARTKSKGSGLDGRGLLRLDAPLREVAAGFLRPRPLLFGGLLDVRRVDYRPVASLNELAAAASALSEAAFRAALLEKLGATEALLHDVDDAALPAHGALLGAYLAHAAAGTPGFTPGFKPVDNALSLPTSPTLPEHVLRDLDERVRALAPLPGAATADDVVARTRAYVRQVWGAVTAELAHVKDTAPDTRFLSSLWTR